MSLKDQIKADQKSIFFNTDDFAGPVMLVAQDRTIIATFKIEGDTIELMGDNEVVRPMLKCAAEDVTDVKNEDEITVDGKTFYVKRKEPKSQHKVHIYLSEDTR